MKKPGLIFISLCLLLNSCKNNDSELQWLVLSKSFANSNKLIRYANVTIYDQMAERLVDPISHDRAVFWSSKTKEVGELSLAMNSYIEHLKEKLVHHVIDSATDKLRYPPDDKEPVQLMFAIEGKEQ